MTPDRPDTETGEETRTEASGEKGRNAAAQEALVLSWDSQSPPSARNVQPERLCP